MCVIVAKSKGKFIRDEQRNCWDGNSHGAGVVWLEDGKLHVKKVLKSFKEFWKILSAIPEDAPAIAHYRISTSGGINTKNIHPFPVHEDELFMAHNGILSVHVPKDSPINDTQIFINKFLKDLPKGFHLNDAVNRIIGEAINSNKFAFLDIKGNISIINRHLGEEPREGVWYSNSSYKERGYSYYGNRKVANKKWEFDSKTKTWKSTEEKDTMHGFCDWCGDTRALEYYDNYNSYLCEDCVWDVGLVGDLDERETTEPKKLSTLSDVDLMFKEGKVKCCGTTMVGDRQEFLDGFVVAKCTKCQNKKFYWAENIKDLGFENPYEDKAWVERRADYMKVHTMA